MKKWIPTIDPGAVVVAAVLGWTLAHFDPSWPVVCVFAAGCAYGVAAKAFTKAPQLKSEEIEDLKDRVGIMSMRMGLKYKEQDGHGGYQFESTRQ